MNTKITLESIRESVETILENYPTARNSDAMLIRWLYFKFYGVDPQDTFEQVLIKINEGNLPCFETVRRTRQKIQQENKHRANGFTERLRDAMQECVLDQVRSWK